MQIQAQAKSIEYKPFYKVIILSVGMFESIIIDERHFPCEDDAKLFANNRKYNNADIVPVIVKM